MKRCPTCNRTYADDALSFCLDDGAPLLSVGGGGAAQTPQSFDPNATLAYPAARDTSPPTQVYNPNSQAAGSQIGQSTPPPPNWSQMPGSQTYPQPPRKRSSALPWVLGGAAVLLVLGIGVVVLFAILASMSTTNTNRSSSNSTRTVSNANTRAANANNANSRSSGDSTLVLRDDFSTEKWATGASAFDSRYEDGEYHMHSTTDQYAVVLAPDEGDYSTKDRIVRATARSVDGTSPPFGYGLVIHGQQGTEYPEGYAFLINTGDNPSYLIFYLGNREEDKVLVKSTSSSVVRTGTNPNQLEVRVKGSQLSFYVNGQFMTSIKDEANFGDGRVGFFTSNVNEVAFDDLEISKPNTTSP